MDREHRFIMPICLATLLLVVSTGLADVVNLNSKSLTDLLGSSYTPVGTMQVTQMQAGNLMTDAYSQAFTNGTQYVYLYQVVNDGTAGNSSAELLVTSPFVGATDNSDLGTLTGTLPAGFISGGVAPEAQAYVDPVDDGPEISFYYSKKTGHAIPYGHNSLVMYVLSDMPPGQIQGNVIDGAVATGLVVGPVPEPASLCLLAMGGIALIVRRRTRK